MLDIYEHYQADPDRFSRAASSAERAALSDADWHQIDELLQQLGLSSSGLAAQSFQERVHEAVKQASADDTVVVERLKALASRNLEHASTHSRSRPWWAFWR
jgi:DNA invertase Pin-like site-specific DNA recombinase